MRRAEPATSPIVAGREAARAPLMGPAVRRRRDFRGGLAAWLPALPLMLLILFLLFAPAPWLIVQSLMTDKGLTLDVGVKTVARRITRRTVTMRPTTSALASMISTPLGAP